MKAKIDLYDIYETREWTFVISWKRVRIDANQAYKTKRSALSAARRAAKQLNLTIEE